MTEFRKTVIINGEEYVPVSPSDEYDYEVIYFAPKKEWDALVEKYDSDYDLIEYWYAHRVGVYETGELTEYVDEFIEGLREEC